VAMVVVNSAFELRRWAADIAPEQAVAAYAATLGSGFYKGF
jgi:hypothetical protein